MAGTVILGGGFGGITVATELRRLLGDGHEVLLLDRRQEFLMGLRKLWAVAGLGTLEQGRRSRERLAGGSLRFLRRTVEGIDPASRRVTTDDGTFEGDYLVVALGAEPRGDLVAGFPEHAHDLFDAEAVPALQRSFARFDGGTIAVVVAGVPYKCPPAPYECAMLLDEALRARGARERSQIVVTTPQPILMPNAGVEGSRWLGEQLAARGIESYAGRAVDRFERGRVVWAGAELAADLIVGVPPHRPPRVVGESALAGAGGWIEVDPATLQTQFERVFAIGDATAIELANGLPLPKAGVFAEAEGRRVAAAIAAEVRGEPPPPGFDGRGFCFIELGRSAATRIEGDFFARPEPRIELLDVSAEHAAEKRRFESSRLEQWFGAAP